MRWNSCITWAVQSRVAVQHWRSGSIIASMQTISPLRTFSVLMAPRPLVVST